MNQEQKFDKIIKKKVDEAEFHFDEQNWNKLSMQLDAERRLATSKGWGKFLFLGLLFLGVTSASIALYKIQGPLGFKDKLAGNITSTEDNNSSAKTHGANGNTTSGNNSENNLLASNNSNHITNVKENYLTDNSNAVKTTSGNNSVNIDLTSNAANNVDAKDISNSASNVNNAASANGNSENTTTRKVSKKGSSFTSFKGSGISNNSLQQNGNVSNDGSNQATSADKLYSSLDGEISLQHSILDRIDARIPILPSNRNVNLKSLKIPNWYEEDYHRKGKKRLSFLNAELGGAFITGWDSKDGKDGRGLNWYAGVNYGKFISRKVGFSGGVQFYTIGNIKEPFYESSKSVYGLGSTSSNTVITTQSLSYFAVPVKFYYAIKPAHQIGLGVNSSFLFSSTNIVENYRLTDNIKSNESKVKTSGIYEGVRLNNVLVSAFYRVKINKRMFINTEVLYGLRDIFKNTSTNNYEQKPLGLRLGLQYTLFEK